MWKRDNVYSMIKMNTLGVGVVVLLIGLGKVASWFYLW